MFNEIRKIGVIIKRDFKVYFTYKLAVSMAFLSIIFNFLYMALFGSMFAVGIVPAISVYGGDFISYILVGSIGWGFIWSIMSQVSESLRTEMEIGTLESILMTPTNIYTMTIAYTLFGSFFGFLSIIGLVLIGYVLYGVNVIASASIFTLIIFVLSVLMMTGLGMILGGLTVWIKNIGQTAPFIQSITMFFCGVYFPITVLPDFLQPVAKFIPFYYFIEGLRKSLVPSTPNSELLNYVLILLILSILFFALGSYSIKRGIKKAKIDGSLSYY
jgi:ABC-2 type transport system permease protein